MKTKTTIKYIKAVWGKKFYCGYCDLQYIMRGEEPTYYNCGVYGWNCDIYTDFKRDIAITTGYRNMTGRRIPDEIIKKYTESAKKIIDLNNYSYEEKQNLLEANRQDFYNALDKI